MSVTYNEKNMSRKRWAHTRRKWKFMNHKLARNKWKASVKEDHCDRTSVDTSSTWNLIIYEEFYSQRCLGNNTRSSARTPPCWHMIVESVCFYWIESQNDFLMNAFFVEHVLFFSAYLFYLTLIWYWSVLILFLYVSANLILSFGQTFWQLSNVAPA